MITVETLSAVITRLLPEPHAGLLNGILFGTKSGIPADLNNNLITTGVVHIVALSGMNISLVTGFVGQILKKIVSRRVASLSMILGIIIFVNFVGPSASIVRAAIMSALSLIAVIFGKEYWALWSWVLAVTMMLLLNIAWLGDLSFQLSALSTLGIILFNKKNPEYQAERGVKIGPPVTAESNILNGPVKSLLNIIYDELHLTLSAQVFTIPLVFLHFHRISLISPLTNILIGWTILPVSIFGWTSALLGLVWLPLGKITSVLCWALIEYLINTVDWIARMPWSSVSF